MIRAFLFPALGLCLAVALFTGPSQPRATDDPRFVLQRRTESRPKFPDRVDFSQAPAPGLKFRLVETGTYRVTGTCTLEGQTPQKITQDLDARLELIQKVLEVKKGRVSALTRKYEKYTTRVRGTGCCSNRAPEEKEPEDPAKKKNAEAEVREKVFEHPLSGKHLRATWKDGKRTLEVREGDAWKPAGPAYVKSLSSRKLLQPVLPLPAAVMKVGETRDIPPEVLRNFFRDGFDQKQADARMLSSCGFTFTGFEDHQGEACAVLKFRLRIKTSLPNHPGFAFHMEGRCHYNLGHRILVALEASGTMTSKGDAVQGDSLVALDLKGTIRSTSRVKVLESGKEPPEKLEKLEKPKK